MDSVNLKVAKNYDGIEGVLVKFKYHQLKRNKKSVMRQYKVKATMHSLTQVSRLMAEYKRRGVLKESEYRRHGFSRKYAQSDIEMLTRTDELLAYFTGRLRNGEIIMSWDNSRSTGGPYQSNE